MVASRQMVWQQKAGELFNSAAASTPIEIIYLLTHTLLSHLLPLSFVLLARLSSAQYYLQTLTWHQYSPQPFPYLLSLALHITSCVLYILVSIVSIAPLIHGMTAGKITFLSNSSKTVILQPHLYTAWILLSVLCTFQVCVCLGIEGTIFVAAGVNYDYNNDSIFGIERISLLSKVIFLLGLHETTQVWSRMVVRPVVDDTVFGVVREERWIEKVAMAATLGTLWWWRLREEMETLVVMDVGMGDFVGWWLYYVTVTIEMVKVVKGLMWMGMICLFRRRATEISTVEPCGNNGMV